MSSLPAKVQPASTSLSSFESAKQALAVCVTIDEVKEIHDRAEALRVYHKQAGDSLEMQNQCCEIKLRAERRGGELLKEMKELGQRDSGGRGPIVESQRATQLSDLGINKSQSSRWQKLAGLPEPKFDEFIENTITAGRELTSSAVLRFAKAESVKAEVEQPKPKSDPSIVSDLSELTTKFRCLYADPPWRYGNQATRAATNNHYVTMTVEEIAALPIVEHVEDEAVLFLWTTNGFLFESRQVVEAWGFEFKSSMVWVKDQMGIGNYVRNAHEFLLICSRGGLRTKGKSQISWVQSPRTKHSRKPAVFREIVEKLCDGPRLELFARQASPGWVAWGNEVESTLFAG